MDKNNQDKKISDTLNVIKKALQEKSSKDIKDNVLILNKLINDDGTITTLEKKHTNIHYQDNISELIDNKIEKYFKDNLDNWLSENMPNIIKNYYRKDD